MENQPAGPITPNDLFSLKFLSTAELSPDGQRVVYAVSQIEQPGTPEEKEIVTLWVLSLAEGAEPQRLTSEKDKDTAPRWSPDGRQIAYLSTRGDKPQIYVIPADGGEPRAVTSLPEGAGSGPVWSPDGTQIAFSAGPQDPPPDPKLPYRLTRTVYRYDGMGYLDRAVQDLYVVPAGGGEARRLTQDAWHNGSPKWSPDGREILYLASMNPDSLWPDMADLRVVSLDGGARELTQDWGYIISAAWSPDGKQVLFIGTPRGIVGDVRYDLYTLDARGGQAQIRTGSALHGAGTSLGSDAPALRETAGEPIIAPTADGSAAFFNVQIGSAVHLMRVSLNGPEAATVVVSGDRNCILIGANDKQLLFGAGTMFSPPDLYLAGLDGSGERRLTELNDEFLATRERPRMQRVAYAAPDGQEIEGWLVLPAQGEGPFPTVLDIHGGPTRAYGHAFMFDFHMLAAAGYAVLFINYRGSSGYGNEFASEILGDLGRLEYDDLMAGLDAAIAQGLVDPDRLACKGGSYGGYLTCWVVGHTNRFKAAIAERSITNIASGFGTSDIPGWWIDALGGRPHEVPELYARCSPITYAHHCQTPALILTADEDYRCPVEQSEEFYTALRAVGCPAELLRLPGSSHSGAVNGPLPVRRAQNEALLDWLRRYVPAV